MNQAAPQNRHVKATVKQKLTEGDGKSFRTGLLSCCAAPGGCGVCCVSCCCPCVAAGLNHEHVGGSFLGGCCGYFVPILGCVFQFQDAQKTSRANGHIEPAGEACCKLCFCGSCFLCQIRREQLIQNPNEGKKAPSRDEEMIDFPEMKEWNAVVRSIEDVGDIVYQVSKIIEQVAHPLDVLLFIAREIAGIPTDIHRRFEKILQDGRDLERIAKCVKVVVLWIWKKMPNITSAQLRHTLTHLAQQKVAQIRTGGQSAGRV